MSSIHTHDMISARDKKKSSLCVQRQALQIAAADIPLGNYFVRPHIKRDRCSDLFDVCIKKTASVINGVAFRQILQRNFRFPF